MTDNATDTSDGGSSHTPDDELTSTIDETQAALGEARRRLAEAPAHVVVVNHVMGLYELAAIHLSATPPALSEAALAIDAVGCLVDGLGARLGPDAATLGDALSNIRLAFVQIKGSVAQPGQTGRPETGAPDHG